jgi:DNA polymerase I-like protein with 3'-5' exonuclease and polymerase domains
MYNKKWLILDSETSIKAKGNPFTEGNRCCYIGWKWLGQDESWTYLDLEEKASAELLQGYLSDCDYLVAFNSKFDIHWLLNCGLDCSNIRIWDCQYAEFLFSGQSIRYPSLEETAVRYGFGHKLDIVKTEYWDKGIDTPDIPKDIILPYLKQDVDLTEKIVLKQLELFETEHRERKRLFFLHMEDQKCLIDMERAGILYDVEASEAEAIQCSVEIESIENELRTDYNGVPINFDSGDHLSAYLYGGTIVEEFRVPVGVYKTGQKVGQPRYKIMKQEYVLPRLFEPIPKSEVKKEGFWKTDEDTLRRLKGTKQAKRRIGLLDKRAKLEKLRGTYFVGFPKKIREMEWSGNIMHSALNQCTVVTGRLSSTNPNQQNVAPEAKRFMLSRY